MKSGSSALVGIGIGAVLGYLFGVQRGDFWVGGTIAVTSSIAGYGFLAYPQYRTRWSGSHSKFWYTLFGGLTPIIMFPTPNSTLLANDLSIVVLLGCLWLGGVYVGVALVRESPSRPETEVPSTPQSSSSD